MAADSELRPPLRIVLVDDDSLFVESLGENLRDAGFAVQSFISGDKCLGFFDDGGNADLLLLDWKMDGTSGIEVLRRLRDEGKDVPAIFLTALTDQMFEEAALATGAVDFVDKARSFSILRRRIDLILSGRKLIEDDDDEPEVDPDHLQDVRVGDLRIEAESHRVIWRDQHVELTLTEFMLVYRLAVRAGKNVSYRELYDVVHGEGFVAGEGTEGYRANVRTLIKRIRQKFRNMDTDFDEIRNYPGFGYRWRDPDKESGAAPA